MEVIRKTKSRCHKCAKEVDGAIVVSEGRAYIHRECPEHGSYQYLLSEHGEDYADLDRFYVEVYETSSLGRKMHTWITATMQCQQKCPYCSIDCANSKEDIQWEDMSWEDLQEILRTFKGGKLSLSGGEPTLHPNVLDFFREADRRGFSAQLATNGLKLVSREYCQKLKENKVKEVRLSLESVTPDVAAKLGLGMHVKQKLQAIQNLCDVGISVLLSPTIFKGINEEQLYHIIEYAKDKPGIHAVSAEGFSWNGSGVRMPPEMMIAPDEMMDTIHRHYCKCERRDLFALQKLAYALMNVVGFDLCLKSEFMVFLRRAGELHPLTEFINVRRVGRMLDVWRRIIPRQRWIRGILLLPVLAGGITFSTIPLLPVLLRMVLANFGRLDVHRYPSELVAVALNTNCSTLNADSLVIPHCISGYYYKCGTVIHEEGVAVPLLDKEERNYRSGFWQRMFDNKWHGPDGKKDD